MDGSTHASGRRVALARIAAFGAAAAMAGPLAACKRRSATESIVVYTSADDALARIVFAACEAATGVRIEGVFDTEATKNTGLENRLRAERERPRADLFWSSEGFSVVRLASEGLLEPLSGDALSRWPAEHRDADGRWAAFSARARVVVTNKRTGARDGTPPIANWAELASPERRGKVAIADPRFGTTRAHLAALEQAWYAARAQAIAVPTLTEWLAGLRRGGVSVLPGGNAATVEAVAAGECAYGLTDTDDALAAIARGLPIEMTLPRTLPEGVEGGGTMIVPNTIAKVAGRPHAAKPAGADPSRTSVGATDRVVAWFLSAPCEELIANSPSRNLPLGGGCDVRLPYGESSPLRFDLGAAARRATDLSTGAFAMLTEDSA